MSISVRYSWSAGWLGLLFAGALAAQTPAVLPAQEFVVSLRQVDEQLAGYSVSTQASPLAQAQSLRLRNGAAGSLQLTQTVPMLWTSSVSAQTSQINANAASSTVAPGPGTGAGVQASSTGGSVSQSLTWMQAGQSLQVKPVWTGAGQPVQLEVAWSMAAVDQRQGGDLPTQQSQQFSTSVLVPLGLWVTLAASGPNDRAGVYSSNAKNSRRLLQVRVSLQ